MKKIFLLAIAGMIGFASMATANDHHKRCKDCTKAHCTVACKDKVNCTKTACVQH